MSDLEFSILDELYFVKSFTELIEVCDLDNDELKKLLGKMHRKGWIKILKDSQNEVPEEDFDFEVLYKQYYYVASKMGLLAHNTI
ncbi:MAG TPA: transporter [Cyclobacteriaceae bacterium]